MTNALSLKKRVAHLNGKLNVRTEYHGDEPVGACDLTLSGLALGDSEVDELLGEGTWNRLYAKKRNSGMSDFPELAEFVVSTTLPLHLDKNFEKSKVTLFMGIDNEDKVELVNCKLARIRYEPKSGGMTDVTVQVQCNADGEQLGKLYRHMDTTISASVRFGKLVEDEDDAQDELPMDGSKGGAREDDEQAASTH